MPASRDVVHAASIVMVMTLLSRLLGFVRDAAIVAVFGATSTTDAYLVAYTLPYSLQAILGIAFMSVIVPVMTGYQVQNNREEGWHVASSILNWTTVGLAMITALGILLAPWIVRLIAPGFEPGVARTAVSLTRVMFPSLILMGVGMFISGILNASRFFAVPAFAPGMTNILVIAGVLLLGPRFSITAVAWATLAGFLGFLLIQLPNLKTAGFRYRLVFDLHHPVVRQAAGAAVPMLLAVAVNQVYLVMNRFFASSLAAGSITALDLGNRALNLPGIFVNAIYTATFPALAERAVRRDQEGLSATLNQGLNMIFLVILPASAILMILRVPLVTLLYQRGQFGEAAAAATATAFLYFLAGFPAQAANQVLTRTFYAMEDVHTPVRLGCWSIGLNALFSILLVRAMGHGGLALANSLATVAYTVMLFKAMLRPLPGYPWRRMVFNLFRVAVASLAAGLATALAAGWLAGMPASGKVDRLIIFLVVTGGLGMLVYLLAARLLRIWQPGLKWKKL